MPKSPIAEDQGSQQENDGNPDEESSVFHSDETFGVRKCSWDAARRVPIAPLLGNDVVIRRIKCCLLKKKKLRICHRTLPCSLPSAAVLAISDRPGLIVSRAFGEKARKKSDSKPVGS